MSNQNSDQVNSKLIPMIAVKTIWYHIMVDAPDEDKAAEILCLLYDDAIKSQSHDEDTEWEYYPDLPDESQLLGVEN